MWHKRQRLLEQNLGHGKALTERPVADLSGPERQPNPAGLFGVKSPFKGEICWGHESISVPARCPSLNPALPRSDIRAKQGFGGGCAIWHWGWVGLVWFLVILQFYFIRDF